MFPVKPRRRINRQNTCKFGQRQPQGIIINAGGYTHISIALRDALLTKENVPIVEVHLSNIFKREKIRHIVYRGVADSIISGCGHHGYIYGFQFLLQKINGSEKS